MFRGIDDPHGGNVVYASWCRQSHGMVFVDSVLFERNYQQSDNDSVLGTSGMRE